VIDQQLLARIDAIEPTSFAGQAFRHLAHDHHPLSGMGARIHGGRWNPPESFSTLYLALDRETTVREFYRLAERQGRDPEDFLPRRLYRYGIALAALLDLREPATRTALQLSDPELRSSDALQNLTEALVAVQLVVPGVYVAMHNTVLAFPGVTKDPALGTFIKRV